MATLFRNVVTVLMYVSQMASTSDVILENMLPGKLSEYGLGYEQLYAINPRLIYVSITGLLLLLYTFVLYNVTIFSI